MSTDLCEFMTTLSLRAFELVFTVTGRLEVLQMLQTSKMKLCIHAMDFTRDDWHKMQLDPNHIPSPTINDKSSSSFCLSTSMEPTWVALPLYSF